MKMVANGPQNGSFWPVRALICTEFCAESDSGPGNIHSGPLWARNGPPKKGPQNPVGEIFPPPCDNSSQKNSWEYSYHMISLSVSSVDFSSFMIMFLIDNILIHFGITLFIFLFMFY